MEVRGRLHATATLLLEKEPSVPSGAGLDAVKWRNISCPCRESNHDRPTCSPSLYRLSCPSCEHVFT
jgi:hypothetical protein